MYRNSFIRTGVTQSFPSIFEGKWASKYLKFGGPEPACAGRCPTTKSVSKNNPNRKTTRSSIAAPPREDDIDDHGGGANQRKRTRRQEAAAAVAAAADTLNPHARLLRTRCSRSADFDGKGGLSRQARFVRASRLDLSIDVAPSFDIDATRQAPELLRHPATKSLTMFVISPSFMNHQPRNGNAVSESLFLSTAMVYSYRRH
jgi:hypothetical protein